MTQAIRIVEADGPLGGGRYDFTKLPSPAITVLFKKKERNVRERVRLLAVKGHWVVGYVVADFRVLVSGKRVVFITHGQLSAEGRSAASDLVMAAIGWSKTFDSVEYVKVEADGLAALSS